LNDPLWFCHLLISQKSFYLSIRTNTQSFTLDNDFIIDLLRMKEECLCVCRHWINSYDDNPSTNTQSHDNDDDDDDGDDDDEEEEEEVFDQK